MDAQRRPRRARTNPSSRPSHRRRARPACLRRPARPARPDRTTEPTRSATNAEPGAAASSAARATLDDPPVADHADLVRERRGLLVVVGDEQGRHAGGLDRGRELARRATASRCVERAQRLVEKEDRGLDAPARARARRAGALRPRASAASRRRARRVRSGRAARAPRARRSAAGPAKRVGDVPPRAQVREERVVLKEVAATPLLGRDEGVAPPSPTRPRLRTRPAPSPAARGRRRSEGATSCRRPTGRPARGTPSAGTSSDRSSSKSPSCCEMPSIDNKAVPPSSRRQLHRREQRRRERDEHR